MQQNLVLNDETRLILRPPTLADATLGLAAVQSSHREIAPWMDWCHADYALEDAEEWISDSLADDAKHPFLIFDEAQTQCLGSCGLDGIDGRHRNANLGYWVRTSHTGQGIAVAATRAVAQFAFEQLELVRVEIVAALGNLASQRVARKAGATREGVLRNGLMHDDQPRDAVLFSLTPPDLR